MFKFLKIFISTAIYLEFVNSIRFDLICMTGCGRTDLNAWKIVILLRNQMRLNSDSKRWLATIPYETLLNVITEYSYKIK